MNCRVPHAVLTVAALLPFALGSASSAPAAPAARAVLEEARSAAATDPAVIAKMLVPASPRTVAELRLLLADADPAIRGLAVGTLSALGDHPVQTLVRLLNDEDAGVRLAAGEALVAAGARAVVPLGEILMNESCLSVSFKAAARLLGRIGEPAGVPYLGGVLVKYRSGGFPQHVGMKSLVDIGGPAGIGQILQLAGYRELGEESLRALMTMDRNRLMGSVEALLADAAEDPQLRVSYALQLNEIVGTAAAAPVLLPFFGSLSENADLPPETRNKAAALRNLFTAAKRDAGYYREPLTEQRLNVLYALRKEDEESPFIEARRKREREMDAIRADRKRAEQKPTPAAIMIRAIIGGNVHTLP